jgi:hypothetical protein
MTEKRISMTAPGVNCLLRRRNTDASGELESKPNEGRSVWILRMKIGSGQVMPAIAYNPADGGNHLRRRLCTRSRTDLCTQKALHPLIPRLNFIFS